MDHVRRARGFPVWASLALLCGCTSAAVDPFTTVETVPVEGTVTLDGEPVASADVTFVPDGKAQGYGAFGKTDEAGHYVLQLSAGPNSKPGAIPGKYQVRMMQLLNSEGGPLNPADKTQQAGGDGIPLKYNDPLKPALTAVVPEDGGTIDFELDSK